MFHDVQVSQATSGLKRDSLLKLTRLNIFQSEVQRSSQNRLSKQLQAGIPFNLAVNAATPARAYAIFQADFGGVFADRGLGLGV